MLIALLTAALSLSSPTPAKAGAQLPAARYWTPAFAGEVKEDGPGGQSAPIQLGSMTSIDAERAFAADAKTLGQWTAFRKWSTDDAVMFVPEPTTAHDWLKERKDPPQSVNWWPTASYLSCDGKTAVNTGGWKRPDGSVGYFTTIWQRQADGAWRWVLDSGDTTARAIERPVKPLIRKATCPGPQWTPTAHTHAGPPGGPTIWETDGYSADQSLSWHWIKWSGGPLELQVSITRKGRPTKTGLIGGARDQVIVDRVMPPK